MLDVAPSHVARLDDGTEVKLGVFPSNTKSRRAKLSAHTIQALAALGLEWAA
ncbi:helicase [Streptomyces mirabilis]|uniref:helicase n=1 Tax=Streptomyces mirabilis TaxID=68239 RepID=UPI0033216EA9